MDSQNIKVSTNDSGGCLSIVLALFFLFHWQKFTHLLNWTIEALRAYAGG